jgi:hypothetical protein
MLELCIREQDFRDPEGQEVLEEIGRTDKDTGLILKFIFSLA